MAKNQELDGVKLLLHRLKQPVYYTRADGKQKQQDDQWPCNGREEGSKPWLVLEPRLKPAFAAVAFLFFTPPVKIFF